MAGNTPSGALLKINIRRIEIVDDGIAAILRDMAPAQRVEMVFQAEGLARTLMAAGVKSRHPEMSDLEIHKEVARIWLRGPA